MASAGTITIDLKAQTGTFDTDMQRSRRQFERQMKAVRKSAQDAGKVIGVALAAGVATAAVAIKSAINEADGLSKLSQKVGVTTEALSGLSFAAKLSDVSLEQLKTGIAQLTNRQGDAAQGMQEYARTFDALGIRVKNADGTLRNSMDVLNDVADIFQKLPDGADKTKLAIELFGRAGADLIPLLNSGSKGLKDMHDEAKSLGLVISTETGKQAEEFNDTLTRIHGSLRGASMEIAGDLLPQMTALAQQINSPDFRAGFGAIIEGAITGALKVAGLVSELGNLARFGGEELAARIHGPAGDDLVRIDDAILRQQERIAQIQAANARAGFDTSPGLEAAREKLAELQAQYATAQAAAESFANSAGDTGEATDEAGDKTGDLSEALRKLWSDQAQAAAAAKKLAAEQRRAAKAVAELARESDRITGIVEASYNPQVDQFTLLTVTLEAARLKFGEFSEQALSAQQALDDFANRTLAQDTKEAWDDYESWLNDAIDTMEEVRAETDRLRKSQVQQFQDFGWDRVSYAAGEFGAALGRGEDAFASFGRAGMAAFQDIGRAAQESGLEFSDLFSDVQTFQQHVLPALGEGLLAYSQASGGGTAGAASGAIGGAITGYNAMGGPANPYAWVGAVIGAVVGGFMGSQGESEKHPEVRVGGEAGMMPGAMRSTNSAFGNITVGSREFAQWGFEGQWADALADFDNSVARFLTDTQIADVTEALANFSYHGMDAMASLEEITEARFGVIVGAALEGPIAAFVLGISSKLQDQFRAFADITEFQRLETAGDLLTGTLTQTIILLDEFRHAGEGLGEAYSRLAESAVGYANVAAGIQEELLTADLSDFQKSMLDVQRLELQRVRAMEMAARATGDLVPREEDLLAAREAADKAIARMVAELREASLDIAADLYGRDIADIDAEIQAIRDAEDALASSTVNATTALRDFGAEMQRARDIASATLEFGGLKGQELADFALSALGRGEISLDQALQTGQDVFASGSDFQDFFRRALAAYNPRDPSGGGFSGSVQSERVISAEEQELLDERDRLEAEDEARRRLGLARDLAQNVADLAGVDLDRDGKADRSFDEVMADLGFTPEQLAADLGIDVASLDAYLADLQASAVFDGSLAETLETLPEDIARALFDLLRDGLPTELPEGSTPVPVVPDGTDPGGPDIGVPIPSDPKLLEASESTADTLLRVEEILRKMLMLEGQVAGNTGATAQGVGRIADGNAGNELRRLAETPRSQNRFASVEG